MLKTTSCTVMNLLLAVLLNKIHLHRPKYVFIEFSIDFQLQDVVYCKATNSELLSQVSKMLKTTSCTVMNFLLAVLLNKMHLHRPKYVFIEFSIEFRRWDLACLEATYSKIASQIRKILTQKLLTVMNLFFDVLLNKKPFTSSITRFSAFSIDF